MDAPASGPSHMACDGRAPSGSVAPLGGRGATGEREGEQQAAAGGEGAWAQWHRPGACPCAARGVGGDPLGEADDRLMAGIATAQQADEQRQKRHCRQEEGTKLGQGGPG